MGVTCYLPTFIGTRNNHIEYRSFSVICKWDPWLGKDQTWCTSMVHFEWISTFFFVQCLDWWRNDPCFWCLWKYHANFGHRRWTSSPDLYSWNPSNHMVWWLSGLWVLANSTSEVFWKEVTRNLWNKKLYSDIYIYTFILNMIKYLKTLSYVTLLKCWISQMTSTIW